MIVMEGMEEAQAFLAELRRKAAGDWKAIEDLGHDLVRYAVSVSPIVTGSYAGAHRLSMEGKTATISIDPTARNTKTGMPVTRYAGAVEARHQVYGRTGEEANRLAVTATEDLAKELGV